MDFALQILGAVMIPIYQSVSPAEAKKILQDSGTVGLLTNNARLESLTPRDFTLKKELIVTLEAASGPNVFRDLIGTGEDILKLKPEWLSRLEQPDVSPDDLSAIIYTSGTTGEPKGAMQTHRNLTEIVVDCLISHVLDLKKETRLVTLLHLPLAHIIARNMVVPATIYVGGTLVLAEKEKEKLLSNFKETAPTIFVTVPYVLDKFAHVIKDRITLAPYWRRKLARYALRKSRTAALESLKRGSFAGYSHGLCMRWIDRKILQKIRDAFGGSLSKIMIGGSNSNRDTVEFFWGLGIPVYEGYGATEMTNVACFTSPDAVKLGTVGRAVPGIEVKLASDDEILVRGPNLMKAYWNRPEATAQTIDAEGWYHTGDLGRIDEDGFVKIIDRKKDIFVLATGKNVAPQLVENSVKKSQLIAQVCCVGDGRNYLTALIYPEWTAVEAHLKLIHALQGTASDHRNDETVAHLIHEEILHATEELSDYEKIKKFTIIPEPFSLENGLLTPTLKVRRKNVMKHYAEEIERMYNSSR